MDNKQIQAIKELEKAFKKCKKAKLVFVGCDDTLFGIDSKNYNKLMEENGDQVWGVAVVGNSPKSKEVKTHNTYMDSGGV